MSPAVVLVTAGVLSWLLRVSFVALVPAARLPAGTRRTLRHTGPAALAALVATGLARPGNTALLPALLALLACAVVALRTRNLLASTATALGVFALLTV